MPSHGLGRNAMKSECVLINRHVLPRRAAESGCHLPLQQRGRGLLGLTPWLLMTVFSADNKTFHISEENVEFLIRFAFTGLLSTFWAHSLNGAGWFREHIDAINSSVTLSDGVKEQRWEGDEQPWRCMKCSHERERERNRCCLYSQCVRAARSLCQICIMRGVSLLQCMLLRGLPAVASSRSLFTNAFLFSSSSWLGIRPALPPSMWQACYQHTARAVKAVSNYVQSSGEVLRPFHVFYILCCSLITLIVSSVAQNDRENRILAIDYEEKLKSNSGPLTFEP